MCLALVGLRGCAAERAASAWWRSDDAVVLRTADALADAMRGGTRPSDFSTGDARFDGEWALVSCQMTVLSLAGLLERFPERAERWSPAIHSCSAWLATPDARAFGAEAWGVDALADPDPRHVHAYLGWTAVALARAGRAGDTDAEDAAELLVQRLEDAVRADDGGARPLAELETYPGEVFPPDQSLVIAALAEQGGRDELVAALVARFTDEAVDPATGLVRQTLPGGPVRGSGTALAAHFLAPVDPVLARSLAGAARTHLVDTVGPFGGVREVPRGAPFVLDVDSGPVIFGLGVSASGFGMSSARLAGDEAWFRSTFRSEHTAGASFGGWFYAGGCLGNAILLEMNTAGAR